MVYEIELNLEAFNGALQMTATDTYGRETKGVFIPIDINGGYREWKRGICFFLKAFDISKIKGENRFIITPSINESRVEYMSSHGMIRNKRDAYPIIGNLKERKDIFRFNPNLGSKTADDILGE